MTVRPEGVHLAEMIWCLGPEASGEIGVTFTFTTADVER